MEDSFAFDLRFVNKMFLSLRGENIHGAQGFNNMFIVVTNEYILHYVARIPQLNHEIVSGLDEYINECSNDLEYIETKIGNDDKYIELIYVILLC